jgi:hypothetical protein
MNTIHRLLIILTSTLLLLFTTTEQTSGITNQKPHTTTQHHVYIKQYTTQQGTPTQLQHLIDKCKLVLWTQHPYWLAGHNWCGYQWLAYIPTRTILTITTGPAKGTYQITGHYLLHRQKGTAPNLHADLILQTCIGRNTGFTLAKRLHPSPPPQH